MKLHRFQSNTVAKAYSDKSSDSRIDSTKLAPLVIIILIVANIIKMAVDNDGLLKRTWWVQLLAIIYFCFFPLLRKCMKPRLNMHKGLILLFYDISTLIIYLILVYLYKVTMLTANYPPNVIMIDGYLVLIYTVLFSMRMPNMWSAMLSLLGINITDIVIGRIEFPNSSLSYLINIVAVLLGEVFILYFNEITRRRNFEREFELKEADSNFKQVLTILSEGILLFDRKRNVKYINAPLINIVGKEEKLTTQTLKSIEELELNNLYMNRKSKACKISGKGDFRKISTDKLEYKSLYKRMNNYQNCQQLIEFIFQNWEEFCDVLLKGDIKYSVEAETQIQGLEPLLLEITISFEMFNNRASCLMIFSNITDKNRINLLEKTIVHKDKILATVSHELRAPLNGNINFLASAIESNECSQKVINEYLTPAVRTARYLMTLINDILDMAQLKSDTLRLHPTPKSLVGTVNEALELIEIQAKKKNIALNLVTLPVKRWDPIVSTDHYRLLQVLVNLLSNALKFTFQGSITVRVNPVDPKKYQISVEDTGIGISEEDKKKLFREFAKIDIEKRSEMNPTGVGLGLVIANSLAYLIGNKLKMFDITPEEEKTGIFFESTFGVGSKFSFYVFDQNEDHEENERLNSSVLSAPTERDSSIDPLHSTSRYEYTPGRNNVKSLIKFSESRINICCCPEILVVDDDSFSVTILENILRNFKFSVAHCFNGQQALEEVVNRIEDPCGEYCKPFRLIFLDSNMPVMDGMECASKLREIFHKSPANKAPMVACTGNATQSEIDHAFESGFSDYCVKPINSQIVKNVCKKFIN